MLALVTGIVLPALFATTGIFAVVVLAASWTRYGRAFGALRRELAETPDMRTIHLRLSPADTGMDHAALPALRRGQRPVRPAATIRVSANGQRAAAA